MSRVSVVIPAWGSYARLVHEAVSSVSNDPTVASVIVVDNAASPPLQVPAGCRIVRSERRLTRGGCRNLGLSVVDTEYVLFLDADDLVVAGALARLARRLDVARDVPAVVGRILEPGGRLHRTPRALARRLAGRPSLFAWLNAVWSILPIQGCALLRTATVRDAGGYADADSGEDWALGVALAFRGPIAFTQEPVLVYRLRADSPGRSRGARRALLANAGRIRERVRADDAVRASPAAIALLAAAQMTAALVAHPLAHAWRSRCAAARALRRRSTR